MGTANRPARDRITDLALGMLEDALARAEHGPVDRHHGHRLALAWLAHIGVAQPWQCADFWKEMAASGAGAINDDYARYYRTGRLIGFLDCWHRQLGRGIPSPVDRAQRAQEIATRL